MENKRFLSISLIILAASIVFGSIWIGHSLQKFYKAQAGNTQVSQEKALMTEKESAEYLNISLDQFRSILIKDDEEKAGLGSYDTYRFVPYIKLENGNKMFSRKELDEWIKYHMSNK